MNDLESLVTCPICSNTMREPTTMQCGHSFCRSCTIKWCFEYRHYNCPVCREVLDKSLPNINVSLNSIIYLMETNHIEANFNSDKNVSKLFWSLFTLNSSSSSNESESRKEQVLDHESLMRKVTIDLEENNDDEDYDVDDCYDMKLNELKSHVKIRTKTLIRNDNTLSRLKIFKFPFSLFFTLFGLLVVFFLRKLGKS